ncbi:MAG: Mur ligase family protein [Caldilineaceae bacterium]
MPPIVDTAISQHTLWQALTGNPPPLALTPAAIRTATLDSRVVSAGSLFVAVAGQQTDGHRFIRSALINGATAIICEEHGLVDLDHGDALIVDCTSSHRTIPALDTHRQDVALSNRPILYVVDNSVAALQKVGAFQRLHRTSPNLRVIGITGSVGKTSTKEVTAAVLSQRFNIHYTQGNLNSEEGLPLTLLGLDLHHERAVLEMGMYDVGEIRLLCNLARPMSALSPTWGRCIWNASAPSTASNRPRPNWWRRSPVQRTAASPSSTGTMSECGPWPTPPKRASSPTASRMKPNCGPTRSKARAWRAFASASTTTHETARRHIFIYAYPCSDATAYTRRCGRRPWGWWKG